MRIAFFTDDYLPYIHGVTTSIKTYRGALEELGHEVFIVAPKKPGYKDNDDHVIRMPSVKNFAFENRPTSILYPGLARKLDKYNFDIVHSHMQFYLGVLAHSVAKRRNIPHITTIHTLHVEMIDDHPFMITAGLIATSVGFPFALGTKPILPFKSRKEILELKNDTLKNILKKQGWRLLAEFANRTDVCISPSGHLKDILLENGMVTSSYVFPNSIDTRKYKIAKAENSPLKKSPKEKYILCVARLSLEKRQFVLIDAMRYVKTPNVKLVLAGGGPAEAELKQKAVDLGVSDKVIFTGMLDSDKVASLMKQSYIFALASYRFDNQPMTFLEAAASGLPVVYCDDRLTEGLTKENSILTSGINGEDFAKSFDELLADEDRLKQMSRAATLVGDNFDSMKMSKKLVKLYELAIDSKLESRNR